MSKTIDSRVLEMKFDNKHFEKNVSTTLSSLDKLKQKLKFSDSAKGLKDLNAAAGKVNLNVLSNAVDTVKLKFSSLQVIAATTLANITNSAVNAGKKMISALTIDPIKTGFQEYETQINSVQTILANTSHNGTTLEDVNSALDTLNTYADKTIYNFTEMTRNIGTFTAAGVDLDTSVKSIQGIANLAAVSGSTSQQASTAMYQLSQALASGTVKLQDWNSVVNAGMGGKVFQDALIRTAAMLDGSAADVEAWQAENVDAFGSFRDSLTEGAWLTTDVLTATLEQFTMSAEEGTEEWENFKSSLMEQGYTETQAEEILKMANTATDAATKVKTFTQLWDTLKESVQSGWTQTWEYIIGDFEQAKELLTGISDFLGGIVGNINESRNGLLKGALTSKWSQLIERINEAGISTEDFQEKLRETAETNGVSIDDLIDKYGSLEKAIASGDISTNIIMDTIASFSKVVAEGGSAFGVTTEKLEKFKNVVSDVWKGDYGNEENRIKALADAGYEYAEVQELVNLTIDDHELHLEDLSKAQLKNIGYTDEEIEKIKDLAVEAEKAGTPLNELINDLARPSGRDLLIDTFKNFAQAIIKPLGAIKQAWDDVFKSDPVEVRAEKLYNFIAALNQLSKHLVMNEESLDNIRRVFAGIFAVIDVLTTVVMGPLKLGFKALLKIFEILDMNLLETAAAVGDNIVAFRDWVKENDIVGKALEAIVPLVVDLAICLKDWIIPFVNELVERFQHWASTNENFIKGVDKLITNLKIFPILIKNWIKSLKDSENLPQDIIQGLVNGIENGLPYVVEAIKMIGLGILEGIKEVLGIHSPSTEMFEVGQNIVQGLVNGIKSFLSSVWELASSIGKGIGDIIGGIDFGKILAVGLSVGVLLVAKKLMDILDAFSAPFGALGDMFENVNDFIDGFAKNLKAGAWEKKSKAILNMAIAVAILAAALVVLSYIPWQDLAKAAVAIVALAGVVYILAAAADKMSSIGSAIKAGSLVGLTVGLLLLAFTFKKLSEIELTDALNSIALFTYMVIGLSALAYAFGKFTSGSSGVVMKRAAGLLTSMSVALGIAVVAVKIAGTIEYNEIVKGIVVIGAIGTLFAGIIAVSKYSGKHAAKAGSMLLKMSFALMIMVAVVKMAGKLEYGEIVKGIFVIGALETLFAAIVVVSKFAGKHGSQAGKMMLGMSLAIAVIVGVMDDIGKLKASDIDKSLEVIGKIEIMFAAFLGVVSFLNGASIATSLTLFGLSVAIGILSGVMFLLSQMNPDDVDRGIEAVERIALILGALMGMTHFVSPCKATLIALEAAVALLAVIIAALSFIPEEDLQRSTDAITQAMIAFGILMGCTRFLKDVGKVSSLLWQLIGVVVILAGIISAMSQLETDKALQASEALSLLMTSFGVTMGIIAVTSEKAKPIKMGPLVGVVAALAIILGTMAELDVEPSIQTATALSELLLAMSGALGLLSLCGVKSAAGAGYLMLMDIVIAGLVGILWKIQELQVEPSIETIRLLEELLGAMVLALIPLTAIGYFGTAGLAGIGIMDALIVNMAIVMGAIGALNTYFPELEQFLNAGLPMLEKIGYGIGSFAGNIVGGFIGGAASGLEEIGTHLSGFIDEAQPFIDGVANIKEESMNGIKYLAEAILILTAADMIDKINVFSNDSNIVEFGKQLAEFAPYLKSYGDAITGMDADAVEASGSAAKALAEFANNIPNKGGKIAEWLGENSMSAFGAELVYFGAYMKAYSDTIAGMDVDAVKKSAAAASALAEFANNIPNKGGKIAEWLGENSMSAFGAELVYFGAYMKAYATAIDGISMKDVQASAAAASALAEFADKIPNTGGKIAEWFTGDNKMSVFGAQLWMFGVYMRMYANAIDGITMKDVEASAAAAGSLAAFAEAIPDSETWLSKMNGDSSPSAFGAEMALFGDEFKKYADSISGINMNTLALAVVEFNKLVNLATGIEDVDFSGMSNFATSLGELGAGGVTAFVTAFTGAYETVNLAGVGMMDQLIQGVNSKTSTLTNGFEEMITSITTSAQNKKKHFNTIGVDWMTNLISGVSSKSTQLVKTITTLMDTILRKLESYKSRFRSIGQVLMQELIDGMSQGKDSAYNVGVSIVSDMARGIEDNAYIAANKAKAMAKAALQAARDALGVGSPSTEFYDIGYWVVQGFANGINERTFYAAAYTKALAEKAAAAAAAAAGVGSPSKVFYDIGESAVNDFASAFRDGTTTAEKSSRGLLGVISKISEAININIDTEPTIRPVLDLSDVTAGAGTLSGLFGVTPSIGVLSNVNAIGTMMNRNQNGANDDVVSAIKDLGRNIGNISGNTYNVNGITYDDGSNIVDAVQTLIRAARVERRV